MSFYVIQRFTGQGPDSPASISDPRWRTAFGQKPRSYIHGVEDEEAIKKFEQEIASCPGSAYRLVRQTNWGMGKLERVAVVASRNRATAGEVPEVKTYLREGHAA